MFRYIYRNLYFLSKDLSKNILKALLSSFGILFLISFMVFYLSFRDSVKDYIGKKIFGTMAINEIVIHPKPPPGREVFSPRTSKENTIRFWQAKKISRMKEFSRVYRLIRMDHTTWVNVTLLGQTKQRRFPLFGIEREFFKDELPQWKSFRHGERVPVIFPQFGLQLLNNYMAQVGYPQFTAKSLRGYTGLLKIITARDNTNNELIIEKNGFLHGMSKQIDFLGAMVPFEFITTFCRKHRMDSGKPRTGFSYVRMYARVKDIKTLPLVTAKIKKLGLRVQGQSDISSKASRAMSIIDGMSIIIALILLLLTVISIFNSYMVIVYNRSYDISLKRVIGVSKTRIVLTFLFEAALIGAIYGAAGFLIGASLIQYLSDNLEQWIPALKGLTFTGAGLHVFFSSVGASMLISSLSALIPAFLASNQNLFKTMGK